MSIILVKNNKGGVGKSWLTLQLGHALALIGKNVLILTSDSQNNILDFSGIDVALGDGLESWVTKGSGDIVRLRDNLNYIPLSNNNFSKIFRNKVKERIILLKKEYDYILIDSVPTLKVDKEFEEIADIIVIPGFMDIVTLQGVNKILESVNVKKVKAIIPNRFNNTAYEKILLEDFKAILEGTDILLTSPIRQSAIISNLIAKNKTVWETNSKKIESVQEILGSVLEVILNEK